MPNQRKPDSRSVTCWVPQSVIELLDEAARKQGRTRTSLAEEILEKEVKRRSKLRKPKD